MSRIWERRQMRHTFGQLTVILLATHLVPVAVLRLITYTQAGEGGGSLRGAGYRVAAERPARPGWTCPSRPRQDRGVDGIPRTLWEVSGRG